MAIKCCYQYVINVQPNISFCDVSYIGRYDNRNCFKEARSGTVGGKAMKYSAPFIVHFLGLFSHHWPKKANPAVFNETVFIFNTNHVTMTCYNRNIINLQTTDY